MPTVLRLDATNPHLRMLVPMAHARIEAHAAQFQPDVDAAEYARDAVAKLILGNPHLLVLVLVDEEEATVVGHVLALHERRGSRDSVSFVQVRADENVGDALTQAVAQAIEWAKGFGVTTPFLHTHRNGKEWEKRLGFRRHRSILQLSLEDHASGNGGPSTVAGVEAGLSAP